MCDCMTAAASAADPCRFESLECSSTVPYWLTKSVEGTGRRVPVGGAVGVLGGLGLEWELWVAQGGGGIGQQAGRAGEGPDKGWTLEKSEGQGIQGGLCLPVDVVGEQGMCMHGGRRQRSERCGASIERALGAPGAQGAVGRQSAEAKGLSPHNTKR